MAFIPSTQSGSASMISAFFRSLIVPLFRTLLGGPGRRRRGRLGGRQRDHKGTTPAGLALRGDRSPVDIHDPLGDGQPDPGAARAALSRLPPVEAIENPAHVSLGDPHSRVLYRDHYLLELPHGRDLHSTSRTRILNRVTDQVEHRLREGALITEHRGGGIDGGL